MDEIQFMTTELSIHKMEKNMKENKLVDLSKKFAVDIVNLCTEIKEKRTRKQWHLNCARIL